MSTVYQNWNHGNGLKFSGNDKITFGVNIELLNNKTIFAIVKPHSMVGNDYQAGVIIDNEKTNYTRQWALFAQCDLINTNFFFQYVTSVNNILGMYGPPIPNRTNPFIVCFTEINNVCRIYVDGNVYYPNTVYPAQSPLSGAFTQIAMLYYGGGIYDYKGEIYDIKLFNRGLTESEVKLLTIKEGQIIPSTAIANCIANWNFENKAGTILTDKSVSNYTGTLSGLNTTLGVNNDWIDKYGNSITQY